MLRKRQILLVGAIIFFGSIWLMLSQLDTSSTGFAENESNAEIKLLQSKLSMVEKQLEFNKFAMNDVRNSMETLLRMGNIHDSQNRKELEEILNRAKKDFPVQNVVRFVPSGNSSHKFVETCPAMPYKVGSSDVSMLKVYNHLPFEDPDGGVWKQGYPIVTSDAEWVGKKLKVFVVPHSHNDPGWIKTVDKYFQDQTRHILDNVVDALSQDSKRKFIWAEMSYLSMWWDIASSDRKLKMKQLVDNGQLEMVTAGWVMNDEANTHYFAMVDQMIEGNEWLSRVLGVIPKSGWAIDPFGHTSTMAYILRKMNFKNMLIQRVHYAVKKYLSLQHSLEFRWRQSWASDDSTDIVCHMMPFYSYDIPHTCGPDPKICCQVPPQVALKGKLQIGPLFYQTLLGLDLNFDFARLPGSKYNCPWRVPPVAIHDGNVAERSYMLLDQYRKKSKLFKSNTLLIILGDDFRYSAMQETQNQYDNYGKIISYINSHPELHAELQFGTLSDYFEAMKDEIGGSEQLPSLTGDFFTYADREDHYWSGYYVSRPYHKMQERVLESHLRGAEVLFALALPVAKKSGIWNVFTASLYPLLIRARQNLGLFQHHDGITGTAKDHVVIDYGNKLKTSVVESKKIMRMSAEVLLSRDLSSTFDVNSNFFHFDEIYNAQNEPPVKKVISIPSEESATVVIYNSLAYERTGVISLFVSVPRVTVTMSNGDVVPSQTNMVWRGEVDTEAGKYELMFLATVPATGLVAYSVKAGNGAGQNFVADTRVYNAPPERLSGAASNGPFKITPVSSTDPIKLDNDYMIAEFSSQSGFLQSITNKQTRTSTKVNIDFAYYTSRSSKDKSGAYLFLPSGPAKPHVDPSHKPVIKVISGPISSELQIQLPNLVHSVKIFNGDHRGVQPLGVHVCNKVDVRSSYDNKEIVMRLASNVESGSDFYTDLNGFQIQHRTTYKKLPLQANYYPMPAMAYLQDKNTRLSLLTAQPLGVASLESGKLEVIMDRRLMQDDNRGLGQGVKDNVLTPESFVILVEKWEKEGSDKADTSLSYPSLSSHRLSWEMLNPVRSMSVVENKQLSKVSFRSEFEPLAKSYWPSDLHLLNLRSIQARDVKKPTDQAALLLHRVGHECSFDSNDYVQTSGGDADSNSSFDVPVKSFFATQDARTTSLSLQEDGKDVPPGSTLTIKPMEIEAFKIKLS